MPITPSLAAGQDADSPPTPADQPEPFHLGYRPALDGLRGVSVLAVMLHHSGLLTGGWLGVDVFFALSGFLITSLLLEEHDRTGGVSLRGFYARRGLRLLPALLVLVSVCGAITVAWSPPELVRSRLLYVAAVLLYAANWAMVAGLPLYAFGHTWSLAIEEQFYVLWPPALLSLLRWVRNRVAILLILAGAIAGAMLARIFLLHGGASTTRLFVGLDTRADSVLIGCALAMLTTWRMLPASVLATAARRSAGAAAAVGLCLLFATARYPAAFRDHFASTLTALAAGLLINELLAPGSHWATLLQARPLVGVGRISYGLYLWHFPIFLGLGVLVSKTKTFDPARVGLAWLITFAVCILSFWLLEQPALRLKSRFGGAPARARPSAAGFEEKSDSVPLYSPTGHTPSGQVLSPGRPPAG